MNIFYVYGLFDPKTNRCFYVGKGCNDRMYVHEQKVKRAATTNNPHLDNKIAKVLRESGFIKYVKFYERLEEEVSFNKEDEKILEFGIDNLCNVWFGGKGGRVPSDEVRKKISDSKKGIPLTEEHKQKLREAKLGTTQSDETKRKKSERLKDKPQTTKQKEANKNRSEKMKGRKFSEEHKQKLHDAKLKNPVRYWKDKQHTKETKQKISESLKRTKGADNEKE